MKALIVEDERLSAKRLQALIEKEHPQITLLGQVNSVQDARDWISLNDTPDLLFLDIQLNDGSGFDVIELFEDPPPIIFTTAYDHYAIKAFKFYSVDYLLKPIESADLQHALDKLRRIQGKTWTEQFQQFMKGFDQGHKKRFLIKVGEQFHNIPIKEIAYFYHTDATTYLTKQGGKAYPIDLSLDQLEHLLNPLEFYRVNRKIMVALSAISHIHTYFNSRLLLKLTPEYPEDVIVSRERVPGFKQWIDN